MQLILVMETRKSCNSDYRYLKTTIDYFYVPRSFSIKPIYAKNKSELLNQNKKIDEEKRKYNDQSIVVVCADYDKEDDPLNEQLVKYCDENDFELVWMNTNVEHVYWNLKSVNDKEKMAVKFLRESDKILKKLNNLKVAIPIRQIPSTNVLVILDKYLKRKA